MSLSKPILKLSTDKKLVTWGKVAGSFGYTLRERVGTNTIILALGPDVTTYPAKAGATYSVEARGPRSAELTVPGAAPNPNPPPTSTTRRRYGMAVTAADLTNPAIVKFIKDHGFDSLTPLYEGKWGNMAG